MCGISGFINKKSDNINLENIIINMTNVIQHRGRDGEGYYIENAMALGHRRLAIIDLKENANQPFKTDKYILVFNGEIYNYQEIKKELNDYNYSTNSDTEVIIASYKKWGIKCVEHFRGMWSFILYDKEKNIIFCSRDRFGIKPFYYYDNDNYIAFGSEIKQFTTLPDWKAIGNKKRIQDFFVFGVLDHTEETMFSNVKQLRPGNNLIYNLVTNVYEIYEYYNLKNKLKKMDDNCDVPDIFRKMIKESINEHMISHVEIGACLSGGLDSSTIVTLMNEILKEKHDERHIQTISSCFEDKRYDEQEYIDEVNKQINADSHKIYPDIKKLFSVLEDLIWHQDEPFGSTSIFAQWSVFEEAKNNRLKVMLDGQGADEQLAGYPLFYIAYFSELLFNMEFTKLDKEIKALIENQNYFSKMEIFNRAIKIHFEDLREVMSKKFDRPDIFSKPEFETYIRYYESLSNSTKSIEEFSVHQIYHSSLPQLLHYEDRNSMAHSVEGRVPFLDHRLVEFVVSCNAEDKIKDGISKHMLRKGMEKILPKKITERKDKMGFVTPEILWIQQNRSWFRSRMEYGCDFLGDIIKKDIALKWFDEHMNLKQDFDFTIWRIVCIGIWADVFNIGEII